MPSRADRVRAHVLLCMLAYYDDWHMRRPWRHCRSTTTTRPPPSAGALPCRPRAPLARGPGQGPPQRTTTCPCTASGPCSPTWVRRPSTPCRPRRPQHLQPADGIDAVTAALPRPLGGHARACSQYRNHPQRRNRQRINDFYSIRSELRTRARRGWLRCVLRQRGGASTCSHHGYPSLSRNCLNRRSRNRRSGQSSGACGSVSLAPSIPLMFASRSPSRCFCRGEATWMR